MVDVNVDFAVIDSLVARKREVAGEREETALTAKVALGVGRVKAATLELDALLREGVPEIEYRVANLVPEHGLTMIASPPKSGKTFFAMELTRAVASGTPFLGQHETKQGRVLYFDGENGTVAMHNRLARFFADDKEQAVNVRLVVKSGFCIDEPGAGEVLDELVREWKPDLIIFDSVVRFMQGDENSANDVRNVYANINRLEEQGISIVFLHHTPKNGQGPRGSGDWGAMYTVMLSVKYNKKTSKFTLSIEDHRHLPVDFLQDAVVTLTEEDGHLMLAQEGTTRRERLAPSIAQDMIIAHAHKHQIWEPFTVAEMWEIISSKKDSPRRSNIYKAINQMEEEGLVQVVSNRPKRVQFIRGAFPVVEDLSK